MSKQDLEKLVHAFIFRRLDSCNAIFTGLFTNSSSVLMLVFTQTKKVDQS